MEVKNYYATAQYYTDSGTKSSTLPAFHRYFLLIGFDEQTVRHVNEQTLTGEWSLMSGKKEFIDFCRECISNGRELSELSEFTGQVYKRTPLKKTFIISADEFRQANSGSTALRREEHNYVRVFAEQPAELEAMEY